MEGERKRAYFLRYRLIPLSQFFVPTNLKLMNSWDKSVQPVSLKDIYDIAYQRMYQFLFG